jgi:hypothetical protein
MIDDDIMERRIRTFWGYGSPEAPVWFVGMEEGLSLQTSDSELYQRFLSADEKIFIDLRRDMRKVRDHIDWFEPYIEGRRPRIQPYWRFLFVLYLFLKTRGEPSTEEIRKYQGTLLADDQAKETAALELMPLPSNKADDSTWIYAKYSALSFKNRGAYIAKYKAGRTRACRHLEDSQII